MDGIVLELQREALKQDGDILSLLRKAYLIARKLQLKDFGKWVNSEMNGYDLQDNIPRYRHLTGEVKAWNPYHGWIPVVFNQDLGLDEYESRDSIATLIDVYRNSDENRAIVNFPAGVNAALNKTARFATKYALFISVNQIFNIEESVRTVILEWSIALEENGIIGEGLQFSKEEKEIAATTPIINNYTTNFFGDVSNSQVQQGTDNSTQTQ